MSRKSKRLRRLGTWLVLGFFGLIILLTVVFYIGRNWFLEKTLNYLNEQQPGELRTEQVNLIPFMHFPHVVLQFNQLSYYAPVDLDTLPLSAILRLDDLYVSLHLPDLIRGNITIKHVRLVEGNLDYRVGRDSISNIENALGIRFGGGNQDEHHPDDAITIDLEKIEFRRVKLKYADSLRNQYASLWLDELDSRFKYSDELIEAGIGMQLDIEDVRVGKINLSDKRGVRLKSEITLNPEEKYLDVAPSELHVAGLELETSGFYRFDTIPEVGLDFEARNSGLEVLNFLLLGILNLDEIEQIGDGEIMLKGRIAGGFNEEIPLLELEGSVNEMAFRLKDLHREVSDISFDLKAESGRKPDMSAARIELRGFNAQTEDGWIRGDIDLEDLVSPRFSMLLAANVDLGGLEQILQKEKGHDFEGRVDLTADLRGQLDPRHGEFLEPGGRLEAKLSQVSFASGSDSLSGINGSLFYSDSILWSPELQLAFNGNRAVVNWRSENLIYYLLGYERDVRAGCGFRSPLVRPAEVLSDSSISALLGEEIRGLAFTVDLEVRHEELDAFMDGDSIPELDLQLSDFRVDLSRYAGVSDLDAKLTFGAERVQLHRLDGKIGDSDFHLSCNVDNYRALMEPDSGRECAIHFGLTSDLVRAEDLFYVDGKFILPEVYAGEYLEDFQFRGKLMLPSESWTSDSLSNDLYLELEDAGWKFRDYPLDFRDFGAQLETLGKQILVHAFSGIVGASDFKLSAEINRDTGNIETGITGSMSLHSSLLDINEILKFQELGGENNAAIQDSSESGEAPRLDQIDYPDFGFEADIGELRYGDYNLYDIRGRLSTTSRGIFYLDSLETSAESGGRLMIDGQFNVSDSSYYTVSAGLLLEDIQLADLRFELQSGEESMMLSETFQGQVSARGLAEVFITPELQLDMSTTTAMFQVHLADGRLVNFKPLQAVGKFLDNKDLDNVRFSSLDNTFTLVDSRILVPRMSIESTLGNLILEGEQGLDGSYLYLLRLPTWLVREAAISRLTRDRDDDEEDEIQQMKMGKFMILTLWSDGKESRVRLGDKRDKYRE